MNTAQNRIFCLWLKEKVGLRHQQAGTKQLFRDHHGSRSNRTKKACKQTCLSPWRMCFPYLLLSRCSASIPWYHRWKSNPTGTGGDKDPCFSRTARQLRVYEAVWARSASGEFYWHCQATLVPTCRDWHSWCPPVTSCTTRVDNGRSTSFTPGDTIWVPWRGCKETQSIDNIQHTDYFFPLTLLCLIITASLFILFSKSRK